MNYLQPELSRHQTLHPDLLLDMNALEEMREVMEEEFSDLIHTYLENVATQLGTMRQALSDNDAEALHKEAHMLKSTCGFIGAKQLVGLMTNLETCGRQGRLSEARVLMDETLFAYNTIRPILQKLCAS
jgi:histidine phosphotransfer protein HptB